MTHIIEEGREGGLSAYYYWLHGFNVTSIEYLPVDEVSMALQQMAPTMLLRDGDGSVLVPSEIDRMGPDVAARTLVIFDGEKRGQAYRTFVKIKDRVALAMFDDSDGTLRCTFPFQMSPAPPSKADSCGHAQFAQRTRSRIDLLLHSTSF